MKILILPILFLTAAAAQEYRTIPAAKTSELSLAIPVSDTAAADWAAPTPTTRHPAIRAQQINRANVKNLEVAWIYHSGDGKGNLEANPVIVNGVMYAPTAGGRMVALDAATGQEIWRSSPKAGPLFAASSIGRATATTNRAFISRRRLALCARRRHRPAVRRIRRERPCAARATVAPAIYKGMLLLPCWNVMRAFDLMTGKACGVSI